MIFEIKILGSSSATPTVNRNQSCQLININQQLFLVDCGEGAQMQLLRHKIKISKINHIFISHLHGDHYLGLFGLISSMHLQGRSSDLTIYGPPGLADIITLQLKYSETVLTYPVFFKEIQEEEAHLIFQNEEVQVETIPLSHRIRCNGFIFKEKRKKYRLVKENMPKNLRISDVIKLKAGKDIEDASGKIINHKDLTLPPKKSRAYAYCSDTIFDLNIVEQIKDVDLLYHESTFGNELLDRAAKTYHSTAGQAATIAKMANAGGLIIGHFSTRYINLLPLLEEAKAVFTNTFLANEGESFFIPEDANTTWNQQQTKE